MRWKGCFLGEVVVYKGKAGEIESCVLCTKRKRISWQEFGRML